MQIPSLRVVCIEDDEDDMMILRSILGGCTQELLFDWVWHVDDLHRPYPGDQPDIVFVDYGFNGSSPMDLTAMIHARYGDVPILFLSSWAAYMMDQEDIEIMEHCFQKQELNEESLCEAIRAAI